MKLTYAWKRLFIAAFDHSNRNDGLIRTHDRRWEARRGFALVTTLTLMILLTIIAVGLLTLSSISLRSSTGSDMATARANARLAMMMALAQVQEQFGKDQAISAPAAMLDSTPGTPNTTGVSGVANPHWLGAYSPLNPTDGRFFIRRPSDADPAVGNVFLYDSRYSDPLGAPLAMATGSEPSYPAGKAYNRTAPYNVNWLVSDPKRGSTALSDLASPLNWNSGPGSLATGPSKARPDKSDPGVVLYPKVTGSDPGYVPISKVNGVAPIVPVVGKDGGGTSRRTGSYAYMVSDNSQKFKVNPKHVGNPADKAPQDYTRLKAPADVHLEGTEETAAILKLKDVKITPQNTDSIATLSNLGLATSPDPSDTSTVFSRPLLNSLTTEGYGLFTNPVVGGFRKNLTAFLESKGTQTVAIQSPGTGWKNDDAISDYQPMLASLTSLNDKPQDTISEPYGLPDSVCPPNTLSFAALTSSTDTAKRLLWFSPVMGQLRDYVQLARDTNRYSVPPAMTASGSVSLPSANPASAIITPRPGSGDGGAIDDRNLTTAGLKSPQTTWDASVKSEPTSSPNTNATSHVAVQSEAPRSGCHPVITKAAIHFDFAYDEENHRAVYLLFPRVELYNPYNVTMKGQTYIISIANFTDSQFMVKHMNFRDSSGTVQTRGWASALTTLGLPSVVSPSAAKPEFVFVLEAKDIPPGKSLLFRPDPTVGGDKIGGGKVPKYYWELTGNMTGHSINSMTLTADTAKLPPDENTSCYWIEPNWGNYKNIPADWEPQDAYLVTTDDSYGYETKYAGRYIKLYMVRDGTIPDGYHGNYIADSSKYPLLQMQCPMQAGGNLGQYHWMNPGGFLTFRKVSDAISNVNTRRLFRFTTGIRWGKFEESTLYANPGGSMARESAFYPLLAQYNIRAPYSSMFEPSGTGANRTLRVSQGHATGACDLDLKFLPWLIPIPTNSGAGDDPLNLGDTQSNQAIPSNGANTVNPFFRTGTSANITATPLFEVARESLPILGLAEFRNAPLLPFVQFPSYLVGESLASVFAPRTHTTYTTSALLTNMYSYRDTFMPWSGGYVNNGGFPRGYTNPIMNYNGALTWIGHNYFQAYDASYELNYSLWDRYFLTGLIGDHTGDGSTAAGLLPSAIGDTSAVDLGRPFKSNGALAYNPRIVPNPYSGVVKKEDVVSYHKAGAKLLLDGAFNVNSTDSLAWQALLLSFRSVESPCIEGTSANPDQRTAFCKLLYPYLSTVIPGQPTDISDQNAWQAIRSLSDADVKTLADSIVEQVKRRGPFISLSDFVNRRLVGGTTNSFGNTPETSTTLTAATFPSEPRLGLAGPLQAALDSINYAVSPPAFTSGTSMNNFLTTSVSSFTVNSFSADAAKPYAKHNPIARGAFMPGHLTQGDLLSKIGSLLTVRGDSYTIRSYGDSRDAAGNITAHARCEVVIQRIPEFVEGVSPSGVVQEPQLEALDPQLSAINKKFGRKFNIVSFRWLSDAEIN